MLVPILVGMSHAGSDGVGMVVDLATGFAIDALLPDPRPYQLDKNHKGHFMVVQLLPSAPTTRGHQRLPQGTLLRARPWRAWTRWTSFGTSPRRSRPSSWKWSPNVSKQSRTNSPRGRRNFKK